VDAAGAHWPSRRRGALSLFRAPRRRAAADAAEPRPINPQPPDAGRQLKRSHAILEVGGARATIENLCFLWNCELSPQLAALHAGDHLRVWTSGSEIWQLNHDGELLLDYRQALDAHERSATRQEWVPGALALALFATLAWVLLRRRPAQATSDIVPSASSAIASGNANFCVSFRVDGGRGVHVSGNRSFTVGQHPVDDVLLDRFQEAAAIAPRCSQHSPRTVCRGTPPG